MKALSIRQPAVDAILHRGKDIENRSWQSAFRGWIALHSCAKPLRDARFPRGTRIPDLDALDYSAICGVAKLADMVTKSRSKWFDRTREDVNYGWVLADIIPLKTPIPCKGSLGLWNVPPAVLRKIKRQLPRIRFDE